MWINRTFSIFFNDQCNKRRFTRVHRDETDRGSDSPHYRWKNDFLTFETAEKKQKKSVTSQTAKIPIRFHFGNQMWICIPLLQTMTTNQFFKMLPWLDVADHDNLAQISVASFQIGSCASAALFPRVLSHSTYHLPFAPTIVRYLNQQCLWQRLVVKQHHWVGTHHLRLGPSHQEHNAAKQSLLASPWSLWQFLSSKPVVNIKIPSLRSSFYLRAGICKDPQGPTLRPQQPTRSKTVATPIVHSNRASIRIPSLDVRRVTQLSVTHRMSCYGPLQQHKLAVKRTTNAPFNQFRRIVVSHVWNRC